MSLVKKFLNLIWNNKFFILIIAFILILKLYVFSSNPVVGDSMNPTLSDEDVVLTDRQFFHLYGIDRYDVVIFEVKDEFSLTDKKDMYIKRIIGLPGDTIRITNGILYINEVEAKANDDIKALNFVTEDVESIVIPDNHYYVLGDNRNNSSDSRYLGPIHVDRIKGVVLFRYRPLSDFRWLK